jgi:HCOMODA/2-hydroxy-3-carboxy-muconic semialdehyde decarboxylase
MARAIAPGLADRRDIMEFDLESNPVDRRGRSMFVERFIPAKPTSRGRTSMA